MGVSLREGKRQSGGERDFINYHRQKINKHKQEWHGLKYHQLSMHHKNIYFISFAVKLYTFIYQTQVALKKASGCGAASVKAFALALNTVVASTLTSVISLGFAI